MKERTQNSTRNIRRWLIAAVVIAVLGTLFWGIRWATFARPALPESVAALESDDLVTVTRDPWLTFSPEQNSSNTGFIFYPGGRIDPQGYAVLMHNIAAEGYLVVIPEMPINMAVFNPNIADEIMAYYPDIDHWAIGGHSIGGTMAAQYTDSHRESIAGLVIWASYPAGNSELADSNIPVVSIYGSLDPRVNDNSIADNKYLLPADTRYVRIEGGDHHQFGAYEIKPENDLATIPLADQQEQIIQATLAILQAISL